MFANVLVGVDGSEGARDAIALAQRLRDPGGKLTLVNVHSGALRPIDASTPGQLAGERQASQELLEREREAAGVQAQLLSVVSSSIGHGLHDEAQALTADLLVVGSCHHGKFGRVMLGDEARSALNGAPCAVAIASRGLARETSSALSTIGVGYDGSVESRQALDCAQLLARTHGAQVTVLEVVSIPTYAYTGLVPEAMGETIDELLTESRERLAQLGEVEARTVYGVAGEELASFSNEVDLLIVGSRSYGPIRRLLLGSTSSYLERHAHCSLVVMARGLADDASDRP